MKNILFLSILAINLSVFSMDNEKAANLAEKAYKAYLKHFETRDSSDVEDVRKSEDYTILKNMLENDFKTYSNYSENRLLNKNIKISEPVLVFANHLKNKLSDKSQLFKDLNIGSEDKLYSFEGMGLLGIHTLFKSAEGLTINNSGYFEIFQAYDDFAPVLFYTLNDLTEEQKEIISMANQIGDIYNIWAIKYYSYEWYNQQKFEMDIEATQKEMTRIENSDLLKKLIKEFGEANELYNANQVLECFKHDPNFQLFFAALCIKFSHVEEFLRKFNITDSDMTNFYKRNLKGIQNTDLILSGLGFYKNKTIKNSILNDYNLK